MKRLKNKILIIFLLVVAITIICGTNAYAAESGEESAEEKLEKEIEDKLGQIDFSGIESWLDEYGDNGAGIADNGFLQAVKDIIGGKYDQDAGGFINALASIATSCVKDALPALISVFAIALLYSIVGGLSGGFLKKSTTELIYFACYAAMISIVIAKVASLLMKASATINSMQSLMNATFPILLTLLTALGSVTSASVYKLTDFFKSCANFILGGIFGIFATFLSVQGLTGAIADTVSIKTAKFALQSYIPLLGGYLSDGFDLVLAGLVLIKNSAGLVIALLILAAIAAPVIEIAVFSLGLRLISGLIEPLCDDRFSSMLYGVSKNLGILIAMIIGVGFMFIVTVMLIVATCNAGVV